jgi:hypothetical protein
MIKNQLVQLLADSAGEKFAMRKVALHYEQAYNTIVGQLFSGNGNQYSFFTKEYTVPVLWNSGNPYSMLPATVIQCEDNSKGVRRISTTSGDTAFYPAPSYFLDSSSDCTMAYGFIAYVVKYDRIKFDKRLPKIVTSVLMELVVPFSAWGDDEDIPIPSGVADNIMALAIQTLGGKIEAHTNAFKSK